MNHNLSNELDDLHNESKELIDRYDTMGKSNDKIKIDYESLLQRFDKIKRDESQRDSDTQYVNLINDFKILVNDLIQRIEQLEHKNIDLEQRLRVLENKESERETKVMINKYMIAIQDYNNRYGIENILDHGAKESLKKMRKNRNGQCHYCSKFCDDKEASQRFRVMIQRIETMDDKVRYVIDKRYPGLIQGILRTSKHKLKYYEELCDQSMDEINEWWDDIV